MRRYCSWLVLDDGAKKAEYRPTQKLAQYLRQKGYDGIIYASSMESDPKKVSGALFCPPDENPQCYFQKVVEFKTSFMKKVSGISLSFDEDYERDPTVLAHIRI